MKVRLRSWLAVGLVVLFSAPRILQDLHRFFGHPHTLIQCACQTDATSCSLDQHKEVCPVCSFEFVEFPALHPGNSLPGADWGHKIYLIFYSSHYQAKLCLTASPRAPPVFS